MSHRSISGAVGLAALTCVLLLTLSAPAFGKKNGNRVKEVVTSSPPYQAGFGISIHTFGFALRPADSIDFFEGSLPCPTTFKAAVKRSSFTGPLRSTGALVVHPGKHGKHFSFSTVSMPTQAGTHYVCAYLTHQSKTYARAGIHYPVS